MVVGDVPECGIHQQVQGIRHLLIRQPILNEPSCYTAACHAHSENDRVLGSLLVSMPLEDLDAFSVKSSTDFMLLALLIIAVLVTFLVVFTSKRIKDPLNSLIRASEAVSSGDTSIRLEIEPNLLDDMRMVSLAFNNMLDKMDAATNELQNWSQQLEYKVQKKSEELSEAQNELIHVERIASLGKLSSSVAHEINNPLSGILVYNKLIYKQLNSEEFYHPKKESILKNLKLIETETKRCGDIVRGLLDFSRKEQEDFEPVHMHPLLDETYRLMTHSIKIADISFKTDFRAGNDRVICSPNQLNRPVWPWWSMPRRRYRSRAKLLSVQSIRIRSILPFVFLIMAREFPRRIFLIFLNLSFPPREKQVESDLDCPLCMGLWRITRGRLR